MKQIVLHKMLLYSALYHHQKVRSLECMVKGIFETIWGNPSLIKNQLLRFEKVSDFLSVSEYDFLSFGRLEPVISDQINRILNRDLLKRCLIISPNLIYRSPELAEQDLYSIGEENPDRLKQLREFIWDEIPASHRTQKSDLWIDLPEPHYNQTAQTDARTGQPCPDIETTERCHADHGANKANDGDDD